MKYGSSVPGPGSAGGAHGGASGYGDFEATDTVILEHPSYRNVMGAQLRAGQILDRVSEMKTDESRLAANPDGTFVKAPCIIIDVSAAPREKKVWAIDYLERLVETRFLTDQIAGYVIGEDAEGLALPYYARKFGSETLGDAQRGAHNYRYRDTLLFRHPGIDYDSLGVTRGHSGRGKTTAVQRIEDDRVKALQLFKESEGKFSDMLSSVMRHIKSDPAHRPSNVIVDLSRCLHQTSVDSLFSGMRTGREFTDPDADETLPRSKAQEIERVEVMFQASGLDQIELAKEGRGIHVRRAYVTGKEGVSTIAPGVVHAETLEEVMSVQSRRKTKDAYRRVSQWNLRRGGGLP